MKALIFILGLVSGELLLLLVLTILHGGGGDPYD